MYTQRKNLLFLVIFFTFLNGFTQEKNNSLVITPTQLQEKLSVKGLKLFLTPEIENDLKKAVTSGNGSVISELYKLTVKDADELLKMPDLTRDIIGRRLLYVSREAVHRISTLSLVYRIEKDKKYLRKLESEINALCNFSDWNPSHFLDVGEMAFAISIGIDWCGDNLHNETVESAKTALINKALLVSLEDSSINSWVNAHHNWNQVCHGGLTAAALVTGKQDPDLAARIISRTVEKMPLALEKYSPDGAFPEGPGYWNYGTMYTVFTLSMLQSALGDQYGLNEMPGFIESATYRLMVISPSGKLFNYSDSNDSENMDLGTQCILGWFANYTGDALYFNEEGLKSEVRKIKESDQFIPYYLPVALTWLTEFHQTKSSILPEAWIGRGTNPIAVLRNSDKNGNGFYLGVKGGSGSAQHSNLDAGSFVFETNGIRWSVDPGNQNYHELEITIGADNLWNREQGSMRWELLTKGNLFHSTISMNDERHLVKGFAPVILSGPDAENAVVSVGMTEIFGDLVNFAERKFNVINYHKIAICDSFVITEKTKWISWAMMTTAEVSTTSDGAVLLQDGKQLNLRIIEPADTHVSVISLDPPPLVIDKKIENLKKLEIKIPAYVFQQTPKNKIVVEMEDEVQTKPPENDLKQ